MFFGKVLGSFQRRCYCHRAKQFSKFSNFRSSFSYCLACWGTPFIYQGTQECCKGFWGMLWRMYTLFTPDPEWACWVSLPLRSHYSTVMCHCTEGLVVVCRLSFREIYAPLLITSLWNFSDLMGSGICSGGKLSFLPLLALTLHKNMEQCGVILHSGCFSGFF